MRWCSERRQLLRLYRFDRYVDSAPTLIHSRVPGDLRGKFYQVWFRHLCRAADDDLDLSTGEGVVDGHIVVEDNLAVMVIFGGHGILSVSYRAITRLDPLRKSPLTVRQLDFAGAQVVTRGNHLEVPGLYSFSQDRQCFLTFCPNFAYPSMIL